MPGVWKEMDDAGFLYIDPLKQGLKLVRYQKVESSTIGFYT